MKFYIKFFLTLVMLWVGSFFLCGCGVKLTPIEHYTLAVPNAKAEPSRSTLAQRSLFVNQPVAAPGYDTNRIIFVTKPLLLQAYSQQQWVAPPAGMLMQIIAQQICASGYFSVVLTPPFSGISDFRLDTRLVLLQQEYLASGSQEHLIVWAGFIDVASQRVIANRTFEVFVPTPVGAYNGVLAANQAAQLVGQQITQYIGAQIRQK